MNNNTDRLLVNERFVSIQGESTQAGRVCYFIRLAGCNLKCVWCDTAYALNGKPVEIEKLVADTVLSGVKLVEITGGEPLAQSGTPELAEKLLASGCEVMVETNGSFDISVLPANTRRIVDCKLPASGMEHCNLWNNYKHLTPLDEVKFVVGSAEDFHFALDVVNRYGLADICPLLFSPVWNMVKFDELARWMVETNAPGRMQIQLHKIIWGAEARGV
ncbi:MAG: 7-carboxy-7-deazaguanine synthase QueE [Victivallaceae bacterium]|nr:radical SAM protein [Victivallaceae bacterium]